MKPTEEFFAKFSCSLRRKRIAKRSESRRRKNSRSCWRTQRRLTGTAIGATSRSSFRMITGHDQDHLSLLFVPFFALCSTLFCSYFLPFSAVNFFLLITFRRYIYVIFQRQKVIKKSQTVGKKSRFFVIFLLDDRRIRIRTSDQWIRIRTQESQKHADSDPQHCFSALFVSFSAHFPLDPCLFSTHIYTIFHPSLFCFLSFLPSFLFSVFSLPSLLSFSVL